MKSHRSRRVAAGAAMVLSLTLAGCAQADPGAAAVAGDRVVTESDVRTAVTELQELQLPQQMTADTVTRFLAYGDVLTRHLSEAGVPVGSADARKRLADPTVRLSEPTENVLTTLAGLATLQEAQQALAQPAPGTTPQQTQTAQRVLAAAQRADQEIGHQLDTGQITFNPKYVRTQNNWIEQDVKALETPQAPQG